MSSPVERRSKSSRFAVERDFAPHVDETWAGDFVLELRLLGVAGDQIGAALSEVESHCAESSAGARDTFGDPIEYARSLDLPLESDPSGPARLLSIAPSLVQIVGMSVLLWSFTAWRRGELLEISGGQLVSLAAGLVGMVAVAQWSDPVLRAAVRHPVRLWGAFMAATVTFMVPLVLMDGTVARIGTGVPIGVGAAALLGGITWDWSRRRTLDDPITSPFDPDQAPRTVVGPRTPTRWRRFVEFALVRALIPTWTIVMLALTTWLTR